MNTIFKNYKTVKLSHFTKLEDLFFVAQSLNKNSKNSLHINQKLYKIKIKYFKTANKSAFLTFNTSVLKNYLLIYKNLIIFLKPKSIKLQKKNFLIQNFIRLKFNLLLVKINNRIYSSSTNKTVYFLVYKNNFILLLSHFVIINKKCNLKYIEESRI